MKLNSADQMIVNRFFRDYVDSSFKNPMNCIRLNTEHTDEHRRGIFEVCNALNKNAIPFWTEVRLNCGCIPDVICPTHIKQIIEVLCTETPEMFFELKLSKYSKDLHNQFILIDAKEPFEDRLVW